MARGDVGVVRSVRANALNLLLIHFRIGGGIRLPEDFPSDCEVTPLLPCEVLFNEGVASTPEVVDFVREILPDIDFPVWGSDLKYHLHSISQDFNKQS